jgi:metal-responsive CopG/Arc/MetJ family transcriptional regulator
MDIANMKAIQVTFDEALLERLDRHPSVRERGRSAVVREAAAEYLKRQDAEDIARRYRAGYLDTSDLDDELEGWAGEGAWPDD